jgi:hypothetical protein
MESLGETTGECAGLGSGDFCRDMLKGWISCETQSDAQFFRRYLKVLGVGGRGCSPFWRVASGCWRRSESTNSPKPETDERETRVRGASTLSMQELAAKVGVLGVL